VQRGSLAVLFAIALVGCELRIQDQPASPDNTAIRDTVDQLRKLNDFAYKFKQYVNQNNRNTTALAAAATLAELLASADAMSDEYHMYVAFKKSQEQNRKLQELAAQTARTPTGPVDTLMFSGATYTSQLATRKAIHYPVRYAEVCQLLGDDVKDIEEVRKSAVSRYNAYVVDINESSERESSVFLKYPGDLGRISEDIGDFVGRAIHRYEHSLEIE
jgi:uncharacterized membrane protein YkoI